MRIVERDGPGSVSVNYMWLPTFLGLGTVMLQQLEEELKPVLVGQELTDDILDVAHEKALDFFEKKFPNIQGLRDYLDSLKFIQETK